MSATFVTALFDLQPHQGVTRPHDIVEYLELSAPLLQLPVPFTIFTEPSLAPFVMNQRAAAGVQTQIIVQDFEEAVSTTLREAFEESGKRNPPGNPAKDTPAFMALQHAKFDFLGTAAKGNVFRTASVCWVDAGIAHVFFDKPSRRGGTVEPETMKQALWPLVKIAEQCPIDHACVAVTFPNHPPPLYGYKRFHGRTPGGLFSWPVADAEVWQKFLKLETERGLSIGYPYECDVLYEISKRAAVSGALDWPKPLPTKLFDPGNDYKEILNNFPC